MSGTIPVCVLRNFTYVFFQFIWQTIYLQLQSHVCVPHLASLCTRFHRCEELHFCSPDAPFFHFSKHPRLTAMKQYWDSYCLVNLNPWTFLVLCLTICLFLSMAKLINFIFVITIIFIRNYAPEINESLFGDVTLYDYFLHASFLTNAVLYYFDVTMQQKRSYSANKRTAVC